MIFFFECMRLRDILFFERLRLHDVVKSSKFNDYIQNKSYTLMEDSNFWKLSFFDS
jgi:hypothetical protein